METATCPTMGSKITCDSLFFPLHGSPTLAAEQWYGKCATLWNLVNETYLWMSSFCVGGGPKRSVLTMQPAHCCFLAPMSYRHFDPEHVSKTKATTLPAQSNMQVEILGKIISLESLTLVAYETNAANTLDQSCTSACFGDEGSRSSSAQELP